MMDWGLRILPSSSSDTSSPQSSGRLAAVLAAAPVLLLAVVLTAVVGEIWVLGLGAAIGVVSALAAFAWLAQRQRAAEQLVDARVRERTTALERALAERSLLLREVYHRVKNNLQVVDSLISFQALRLDDVEARAVLDDIRHRVHALGLVHQQLMRSADLATFDIRPFAEELVANITEASGAEPRGLQIDIAAASLRVNPDFAVPLGLLITELLSDALHGYPEGQAGTIAIALESAPAGTIVLTVTHDGEADYRTILNSEEVGGRIIRALVQQLAGEIDVVRYEGKAMKVTMPRPQVG